jgi:hypothetical protein
LFSEADIKEESVEGGENSFKPEVKEENSFLSQLRGWRDNARSRLNLGDDFMNRVRSLVDASSRSSTVSQSGVEMSSNSAGITSEAPVSDDTELFSETDDKEESVEGGEDSFKPEVKEENSFETHGEEDAKVADPPSPKRHSATQTGVCVDFDDQKPLIRCLARSGSCEDIFECEYHRLYPPIEGDDLLGDACVDAIEQKSEGAVH